jgi:hypothetical protein
MIRRRKEEGLYIVLYIDICIDIIYIHKNLEKEESEMWVYMCVENV